MNIMCAMIFSVAFYRHSCNREMPLLQPIGYRCKGKTKPSKAPSGHPNNHPPSAKPSTAPSPPVWLRRLHRGGYSLSGTHLENRRVGNADDNTDDNADDTPLRKPKTIQNQSAILCGETFIFRAKYFEFDRI